MLQKHLMMVWIDEVESAGFDSNGVPRDDPRLVVDRCQRYCTADDEDKRISIYKYSTSNRIIGSSLCYAYAVSQLSGVRSVLTWISL